MKKYSIPFWVRFLIFCVVLAMLCTMLGYWFVFGKEQACDASGYTVVLDAGHGGEDGGTSSKDGIREKNLNLQIAFLIKEELEAKGITVVMTRSEDTLLYDRNQPYEGKKKKLDQIRRKEIAQAEENAVFVSIHMNSYPVEKYHGLQVFYSQNHPDSKKLAEAVQKSVKEHLQPENQRAAKASVNTIYLMRELTMPAILIECGFLSNPEEAHKLTDEEYQKSLSSVIADAIFATLSQNS